MHKCFVSFPDLEILDFSPHMAVPYDDFYSENRAEIAFSRV